MDCKEFKKKSVKRIDFATKEKIFRNCFSKAYLVKDCIDQMKNVSMIVEENTMHYSI